MSILYIDFYVIYIIFKYKYFTHKSYFFLIYIHVCVYLYILYTK